MVLVDFNLLAVLWLTRSGFTFGSTVIHGWGSLLKNPSYINDGTVAIAMSLILFFIPSKNKKGKRILTRKTLLKLPWNILILFGGGFALASGFKESGLSEWFGQQLSLFQGQPTLLIILVIALGTIFRSGCYVLNQVLKSSQGISRAPLCQLGEPLAQPCFLPSTKSFSI